WKERTAMALFEMTGVSAYWTLKNPKCDSKWDTAVDCCAYWMISHTITDDMVNLISQTTSAHEVMKVIEEQFCWGGRTAQITSF
ncbi:hypothetical protein CROQUDRAFT_50640, partial [Cronartium quercuum f. sp. fusiforme G11]